VVCLFFHRSLSLVLLVIASSFTPPAFAADNSYKQVHLPHGISIEIPSHWAVLPEDSRKNLAASSQAMQDNAGIESVPGQRKGLLAVNATPSPTGAMIRVSVSEPADFSLADLATWTPTDLKEIATELLSTFRKMEPSGGPRIIEMQAVRVEKFNANYRALVIPYVRAGASGPSSWQVTQYKIPVANRLVEITLSHRQSDAVLWRPILERVKRSVRF
jgi:hypothetical protein